MGVSLTSIGVAGIVSAKPSLDEIHERAVQIFQQTQDQQRYEQFLKRHGFTVFSSAVQAPAVTDGPSTQEASESDSSISLTLSFQQCGSNLYADLNWDLVDAQDLKSYEPKDGLAIAFQKDDFTIKSTSSTQGTSLQQLQTYNGGAWHFDDYWGYNNDHNYGTATLTLNLRGGQPIYGYYWHYSSNYGYAPSFDILDSGDVRVSNQDYIWSKQPTKTPENVC